MSADQADHPIRIMARVLRVSASGYYAWRSRPPSARATADGDLLRRIRTIHAASRGTYGAPRVHAELQAEGVAIATLECELIDRHRFRSHTEARMAAFHFIEGFYNPTRRHSALGYLSPLEYERRRHDLNQQT
jgi:transposase InsO family protein